MWITYGLSEINRKNYDTLVGWVHEQVLSVRRPALEDLFPKEAFALELPCRGCTKSITGSDLQAVFLAFSQPRRPTTAGAVLNSRIPPADKTPSCEETRTHVKCLQIKERTAGERHPNSN
jgi:hypothetical protein